MASTDGAEVAHVGHTVEHKDEGVAAVLEDHLHHLFERLVFYRADESHHALVVLARQAIHLLNGDKLHRDAVGAAGVGNLRNLGRTHTALDVNLLNLLLRTDQLQHRVDAEHHIILVVVFHDLKFVQK